MKNLSDTLQSVYDLCANEDEIEACAEAIMYVERTIYDVNGGEIEEIDDFLSSLDLKRVTSAVMLSVLTVTKHALEYGVDPEIRNKFIKKAEKLMKKELGKERTEKLLELRR